MGRAWAVFFGENRLKNGTIGGLEAETMVIARSSNLIGTITIFVMVSFVVNTALALDGSGTQEYPWRIKSLEDFNDFAADANYWGGLHEIGDRC